MKTLEAIVKDPAETQQTLLRANILLLSDAAHHDIISVSQIANQLGTSRQTVTKVRAVYHEQGFDAALHAIKRNRTLDAKCFDNDLVSKVKSLLSEAPINPHSRWTIRLLCSECIARGYVDYISPPTMMKLLKRNNIQL